MVANDAAGEGINLQRAHLMVNYDLPWNPNRLEQRFGRIHRIGQREVCHLWNLVASETREGEVYSRLLEKLEQERKDLGGRVYDVLGRLFEARPLAGAPGRGDPLRRPPGGQGDAWTGRWTLRWTGGTWRNFSKSGRSRGRRWTPRGWRRSASRWSGRRPGGSSPTSSARSSSKPSSTSAARPAGGSPAGGRSPTSPTPSASGPARWAQGRPCRAATSGSPSRRRTLDQQPTAAFVCPGHPLLDATLDLVLERHRDLLRRGPCS